MGSAGCSVHLALNNIRRWGTSPRIYILAILGVLWIHYLVSPLVTFSQLVGVRVTPWAFAFALADWYPAMIVMLGVVLLFCDAPFVSNCTPYECIRAGRKRWAVGQIVYVVLAAAAFVVFLVLVSMLCLAPRLSLDNEWGRVYNTLAQTNAGVEYMRVPISYRVILTYAPGESVALAGAILFLEAVFVGLVMFTLNVVSGRVGGVLAGLLLAFMPAFASVVGQPWIYYLTPTAWANLDMLDVTGRTMYPSLSYVLLVLCGAIACLTVFIVFLYRKREIEVLLPV